MSGCWLVWTGGLLLVAGWCVGVCMCWSGYRFVGFVVSVDWLVVCCRAVGWFVGWSYGWLLGWLVGWIGCWLCWLVVLAGCVGLLCWLVVLVGCVGWSWRFVGLVGCVGWLVGVLVNCRLLVGWLLV